MKTLSLATLSLAALIGSIAVSHAAEDANRPRPAGELVGWSVSSAAGEVLGEVSDLAVDPRAGQVIYAIVASRDKNGRHGERETLRAVPFAALLPGERSDRMTLGVEGARWSEAPEFRKDDVAGLADEARKQELFSFYNDALNAQTPRSDDPFANPAGEARGSAQSAAPALVLSSQLATQELRNEGRMVGTIEDVVVDVPTGKAAVLVDARSPGAETAERYVVPMERLTATGAGVVSTTLSRQELEAAPAGATGDAARFAGNVQRWSEEPIIADEGATRVAGGAEREPPQRDTEGPVLAIREALSGEPAQRNINVVVTTEKVVLSGTVQSNEVKERAEERAERAAPGWSIDNQIRVAQQEE